MSRERWCRERNKYVTFRVTPEENERINRLVKLSGMKKQEYLTSNVLKQTITVKGNPRVFKALKTQLNEIQLELKRIQGASEISEEMTELIKYVSDLLIRLNEEKNNK